jgi:hypothetical protein
MALATGADVQTEFVDPPERELMLLRAKPWACPIQTAD